MKPTYLPIVLVDDSGHTERVDIVSGPNGFAVTHTPVVTPATRAAEAIEFHDIGYYSTRSFVRLVKNRIAINHDARATDGIDDGLIRAERWNAVY